MHRFRATQSNTLCTCAWLSIKFCGEPTLAAWFFVNKGNEWHEQRNDGVRFAEKEKIKDMSLLHQIQLRLLSKNLWNWCLLMGYGEIRNKIELLLHSIYLKNILNSESHYGIRMKEHYISRIIWKHLS